MPLVIFSKIDRRPQGRFQLVEIVLELAIVLESEIGPHSYLPSALPWQETGPDNGRQELGAHRDIDLQGSGRPDTDLPVTAPRVPAICPTMVEAIGAVTRIGDGDGTTTHTTGGDGRRRLRLHAGTSSLDSRFILITGEIATTKKTTFTTTAKSLRLPTSTPRKPRQSLPTFRKLSRTRWSGCRLAFLL